MSKNRAEQLKENGIDIKLTKAGQNLLAEILAEGCPIKFVLDDVYSISCPYQYHDKTTCKKCWKKWLKDFLMEGN